MVTKSAIGAQRRLAAIFCADVAGYSRLMSGDERGTLRLLASHREIADREIGQHGGRIANTAGTAYSPSSRTPLTQFDAPWPFKNASQR